MSRWIQIGYAEHALTRTGDRPLNDSVVEIRRWIDHFEASPARFPEDLPNLLRFCISNAINFRYSERDEVGLPLSVQLSDDDAKEYDRRAEIIWPRETRKEEQS